MKGESGVGKSSITTRAIDGTFSDSFISTIGVDFKVHWMNIGDKLVKLLLWDSAGQERFRSITANYFRRVDGAILVFDITQKETLQKTNWWLSELEERRDDCPAILLANKCDRPINEREVTDQDARDAARQLGLDTLRFSSAKSGQGIDDAFVTLVEKMIESERTKKKNWSTVELDNPQKAQTSFCRC